MIQSLKEDNCKRTMKWETILKNNEMGDNSKETILKTNEMKDNRRKIYLIQYQPYMEKGNG